MGRREAGSRARRAGGTGLGCAGSALGGVVLPDLELGGLDPRLVRERLGEADAKNLIIKSFQDGFGGVLGFVGIILALGTMLGKMMADSGGADQIARTLIRAFGKDKVQWAMMFAAFLVGIPLYVGVAQRVLG